ncbi:MAG: hypothetical protein AAB573_04470 [Patescibacteria group bacterium]
MGRNESDSKVAPRKSMRKVLIGGAAALALGGNLAKAEEVPVRVLYSVIDEQNPGRVAYPRANASRRPAGDGTYNNPLTVAIPTNSVLKVGERIFIPRDGYGVTGDHCSDCKPDTIVVEKYRGTASTQQAEICANQRTGYQQVVRNPRPDIIVRPGNEICN